jgi:folate-binding protein YgfZ
MSPKISELEVTHRVPGALDRVFLVEKFESADRIGRSVLSPENEELWSDDPVKIRENGTELTQDEFEALRINAGVPKWGKDFFEDSFLLEFPTAEAISYHKGCYLGQEVVARTVYRGHVTRALCRFEATQAIREDFIFMAPETERPIGKISSVSGNHALGLIRVVAFDTKEQVTLFQKDENGGTLALTISKVLIPYEK